MPKGVEHPRVPVLVNHVVQVRIPMMPKGVEHPAESGIITLCCESENSNDAERR